MNNLGITYDEQRDGPRLRNQRQIVLDVMLDGKWRSLSTIARKLRYPEASISARLRDLRKPAFGSYRVERKNMGGGTWLYRVLEPLPSDQRELFEARA